MTVGRQVIDYLAMLKNITRKMAALIATPATNLIESPALTKPLKSYLVGGLAGNIPQPSPPLPHTKTLMDPLRETTSWVITGNNN